MSRWRAVTNLPPVWVLEGQCFLDGQFRRVCLEIDAGRGVIERVEEGLDPDVVLPDALRVVPGFLDLHVHCRDDPAGTERYKEDYRSASRAALQGGVVLVGDMPNNPAPPVDRVSYEAKRALARERALIDVVVYGGIGPGTRPFGSDLPYKCYYGPSVGNLNFVGHGEPGDHLAVYSGLWVAFHAEAQEVLEAHRGAPTHEERRPPEAEARAIERIAEVAHKLGFHAHIAHLSSAAGLEAVRRARARGVALTCEVAPHHLFFDRENRSHHARGGWLQMNPPLRERADREALLEAFLGGEIDILATDHAPHSPAENARGISGVPHLDTFGAFVCHLAAEGIPWSTLVERCAAAPARLFAPFLEGQLGSLAPGGLASFTVLDPSATWIVCAEDLATRAGWSPFEGIALPGRVSHTAVRGRLYEV